MSNMVLNDGFVGMMASGSMSMSYNQIIPSSSSEGYEENEMREGFREVFTDEFKEEASVKIQSNWGTSELNIPLFPRSKTQAAPTPQIKAVPPPSQPTKPIINEQGRVKRAFDFDA